jgi:dihydroxyacetone kinase-like protein
MTLDAAWMCAAAEALDAACPLLTELDAARGDADHGVNMRRGFGAIAKQLDEEPPTSAGAALLTGAKVLRRTMGGTSGPLWSAALRRAGRTLADDPDGLAAALAAAAAAVAEIGGAQEGDNTMLDALLPAARELERQLAHEVPLPEAVEAAAVAAEAGAASTASRRATKGRASYLGDRGVGAPDPGATSAAIVVRALASALNRDGTRRSTAQHS